MKPLFVMLVTYKRFEHFKQTLESLLPTLPQGSTVGIVDNGDDGLVYDYLQHFTAPSAVTLKCLFTGKNEGWGAAMNEGLRMYPEWKEYEYFLESNNDVTYEPEWFLCAKDIMESYPNIGILGLWEHINHGTRETRLGIKIKDNMPACAWLFRSKDLEQFLPFPEKGPCKTRGGNGEDGDMVEKVHAKGRWVCASRPDLAHHMDGYDAADLGKENAAYK